jgi:NitT/TauT family transport system permease protein
MGRSPSRATGIGLQLGSIIAFIALWQIAAMIAASRVLPSPMEIAAFIADETRRGDLISNVGITLWRVAASFTIAMLVGSAIGVALGRSRGADRAFGPWVLVLLNTPALVITVLCYIWLGLNDAAAILAVALNKMPNTAVTLREGARSLDPGLDEMSRAYRFSRITWLRHVAAPQLAPYVAAAGRSGLGLVWKIVLVVELLGRPNGVGYAISLYFQLFDVRAVIGYAVAFAAVMLAIEFFILQPVENHVRRWRLATA